MVGNVSVLQTPAKTVILAHGNDLALAGVSNPCLNGLTIGVYNPHV